MLRALRYVLLLFVLLPIGLLLAGGALIDGAVVRTQVIAAVERATGHGFRLDGPLRVVWAMPPGVEARDAVLLNPPGFSRLALATARRVGVRLALGPLLTGRVVLSDVSLGGVDMLLERDGSGRGNWLPPPAAPSTAAPPVPRPRASVPVQRLTLDAVHAVWRGGPGLTIPTMVLHPAGGEVSGQAVVNDVLLTVAGTTGPTDRAPVPVTLAVDGSGAALRISGEAGGTLQATLRTADLSGLSHLAGTALPPLRGFEAQAAWAPDGPHAFRLSAGESDVAPGFHLTRLQAWSDGPEAALSATAEGTYRRLPVSLAVNAFGLGALMAGAPVPLQAELHADGGVLRAQGTADRRAGSFDGTASADLPDLARTTALAETAAPTLADVHAESRIVLGASSVQLRGLRASAQQGDLAGDLLVATGPIPSIRGTLVSQHLDLDAVGWSVSPAAPAAASSTQAAPPAAEPAPPRPLPFAALRGRAADLRFMAAQLRLGGVDWRDFDTRVLLADGRLRVDPLRLLSPGGAIEGQLAADASSDPPSAAVILRGTGLDAAGLAAATGEPGAFTGQLDLDVDLHGRGLNLRALAATLDGHAGLAFVDGDIENRVLADLFGDALRAASLPWEPSGRSKLRCLAFRADAQTGQVALRSFALDAARLKLEADGTLDLPEETMDLHLRPTVRLGGTGVVVPVRLTGPFRAPKAGVDRGVIAPGRLGFSIGAPPAADPCGPALAAARAVR